MEVKYGIHPLRLLYSLDLFQKFFGSVMTLKDERYTKMPQQQELQKYSFGWTPCVCNKLQLKQTLATNFVIS
jgi:hypothetical protein